MYLVVYKLPWRLTSFKNTFWKMSISAFNGKWSDVPSNCSFSRNFEYCGHTYLVQSTHTILSVILFSMLFVAFRSGRIMYAYIIREEEYSMLIFSQSLFFYHTRLLFIMRNLPNGQKAILKVFPNSINTQPLKQLTIYDIGSRRK